MKIAILFLISLNFIFTIGCANKLTRNPLPLEKITEGKLSIDKPAVRAYAGVTNKEFQEDFINSVRIKNEIYYPPTKEGCDVNDDLLALSGGGSNGAFGAGFLNGWTDSGKRPVFKLVTGISTGALIAPFAFIGPKYDKTLKEIYTTIETEDLIKNRGIKAIWNESLSELGPLIEIMEEYVDMELMSEVAKAHSKGRRLYIGTTNMDAGMLVIWNMGAIAESGHPESLELFRKILLASSSIPVFFPPVLIEVEADGKVYDEMHVDGGVISQVFFFAFVLDVAEIDKSLELTDENKCVDIYVIRNGKIAAQPEQINRKIVDIAKRSLTMMVSASGSNDIIRIYYLARDGNIGFNYISVPEDFVNFADEMFDMAEMNDLYKIGYSLGKSGNAWNTTLPINKQNREN